MEIFTIASWQIWKQRNDTIFDRGRPSFNCQKVLFLEEAKLQTQRFLDEAKRAAFLLCVELLVFFCFVSLLAFLGKLLLFGILPDRFVQFFFFCLF